MALWCSFLPFLLVGHVTNSIYILTVKTEDLFQYTAQSISAMLRKNGQDVVGWHPMSVGDTMKETGSKWRSKAKTTEEKMCLDVPRGQGCLGARWDWNDQGSRGQPVVCIWLSSLAFGPTTDARSVSVLDSIHQWAVFCRCWLRLVSINLINWSSLVLVLKLYVSRLSVPR